MELLKQVGAAHAEIGDAQDNFAAVKVIPGFVFGYIDAKENRVVSFHQVSPGGQLQRGQQMVEAAIVSQEQPALFVSVKGGKLSVVGQHDLPDGHHRLYGELVS